MVSRFCWRSFSEGFEANSDWLSVYLVRTCRDKPFERSENGFRRTKGTAYTDISSWKSTFPFVILWCESCLLGGTFEGRILPENVVGKKNSGKGYWRNFIRTTSSLFCDILAKNGGHLATLGMKIVKEGGVIHWIVGYFFRWGFVGMEGKGLLQIKRIAWAGGGKL